MELDKTGMNGDGGNVVEDLKPSAENVQLQGDGPIASNQGGERDPFSKKDMPTTSEWLVLDINRVEESHFALSKEQGCTKWKNLPVERVRLPVDDLSTVAVLSWRWDTDGEDHQSRNILSAVLQARRMGVRYLFVDFISIDQQLTGKELLDQIAAFSMLYRKIPVIAAYDKVCDDFGHTIRRPWISNEVQLYRANPTKIVYVGHSDQGAVQRTPNLPVLALKDYKKNLPTNDSDLLFAAYAKIIWASSFATSIMMLLKGTITMKAISDLIYIMLAYAPILTRAYEQMSRDDYLLTATLLAQQDSSTEVVTDTDDVNDIYYPTDGNFTFYEIRLLGDSRKSTSYDVLVDDGTPVGNWTVRHNFYYDDAFYNRLCCFDNAERAIASALHMTAEEYAAYLERKKAWKDERQTGEEIPEIEVVSIPL